jgi:hypothetical protein
MIAWLWSAPPPDAATQHQERMHLHRAVPFRSNEFQPTARDEHVVDSPHFIQQRGYITHAVCRGCRHAIADPNNTKRERCGVYIQGEMSKLEATGLLEDESLAVAADTVAQRFPLGCDACRHRVQQHEKCDGRYWLYDAAAPPIVASHFARTDTWFPHSRAMLSASSSSYFHWRSLPAAALVNLTAYFGHPSHVAPHAEYFVEYNPSIVVMPPSQLEQIRNVLPRSSNSTTRYYLASFRVSNQNYCFAPDIRQMLQGSLGTILPRDYLGLVLLNADTFDIVADVIVDLSRVEGLRASETATPDFRLFVLGDQVYLGVHDWIAPLWLQNEADYKSSERKRIVPPVLETSFQFHVVLGLPVACAPCHRPKNRGLCGKNFNYFSTPSATNNDASVQVEIWPTEPHMVRTVLLNELCQRQEEATIVIDDSPNPPPSFATIEEVDFPTLGRRESLLTRGRGGACCIPLPAQRQPGNDVNGRHQNATTMPLWVGIQHAKTPSQRNRRLPANVTPNHYLSSWYAFEATPPYRIVARSGWFCLGFPNDKQASSPLIQATRWRTLALGQRRYPACPRIHFVSGLTIKATDPSIVIIAYGINDCASRFVEVRLSDVQALLFRGPSWPT